MPAKAKLTTRERTTSNVSSDNLNKGSELSFAEADSNFFNLRDQTFAISDGSTSTDIEAGETITFSGASVSGNTVSITGGSLGDLTASGSTITAPSNANLRLQTSGTGEVEVHDSFIVSQTGSANETQGEIFRAQSAANQDFTVDINHNGQATQSGNNFSVYGTDGQSVGGNVPFQVRLNEQANVKINGILYPSSDGTNGQMIITDGSGNLSFSSTSLTTFGDLSAVGSTITAPSNADLTLATSGTGDVVTSGNHKITGDLEVDVIRPEAAGNDIHILGLDVDVTNRSYVKVEGGAQAGVWIKGAAEIAMDHADSIGSGGVFHSNATFTRFNKGGNDIQNIMFHANQYPNNTHGLLHIETYADRGTTNGVGMVTINDSGIAYNGSSLKYEGQGTEVFNVFGTARLDNVFFKDNKIYTNQSNEDLEIDASGTGAVSILTQKVMMSNLPTSDPTNAGQLWNDSGTLKVSAG